MLKLKLFCLLAALVALIFITPERHAYADVAGNGTVVTLESGQATGAGAQKSFAIPLGREGDTPTRYTWGIIPHSTVSANSTVLEGSLDGTNWDTLDTSTDTTFKLRFVVDKPVKFVRANQGTITCGGTVDVLFMAATN